MSDAAKIRLTEIPPHACSSCFGQYTDRRHVDFNAFYDGPVMDAAENVAGGKGVSIDDLVLCEECVLAASKLLGCEPFPAERIEELEAALVESKATEAATRNAYEAVQAAQEAVAKVPTPRAQPKPPPAARRRPQAAKR